MSHVWILVIILERFFFDGFARRAGALGSGMFTNSGDSSH
jgi:hypothetical protein